MTASEIYTYLLHTKDGPRTCWRHPFDRYGCERSRRILSRFPDHADQIAQLTVEGGSAGSVSRKAVRHA